VFSAKRVAVVFLFLTFTVSTTSVGWGQEDSQEELSTKQASPEEMAKELGVKLPRRPWHMIDLWWLFDEQTKDFESFSMEFTIDRDISTDYNLYIAPIGIAEINGLKFYGGIQSNVNGWASKESRTRVHPGKGAIFSRWSKDEKRKLSLDHVRVSKTGLCESAGYEGEFASVRQPFEWTKGTYTYSITKGETEKINGEPHTWFDCTVRVHATDKVIQVGSLRFEGEDFTFWNRHAAFVEVYATSKIRLSSIPAVKVTFGTVRLNGVVAKPKTIFANYNPSRSPQCAKATLVDDSILVDVGKMFRRSQAEGQELLYRDR